jgi:hypothetical protein
MSDAFVDAVLGRIDDSGDAAMRIGTVTAIDAGSASVTVSLAGDSVAGVRWIASYTPVVGDMIVVSRVGSMLVVLGKLSKQLGGPTVVYESMTVSPWTVQQGVNAGATSTPGSWTWATPSDVAPYIEQGADAGIARRAGVLMYPGFSLPAGATALSAKIRVQRVNYAYGIGGDFVAPTIYGHAYTMLGPSGAPAWVGGYGPWEPGSLGPEEIGVWDLPSSWLTALLAGTITGLGIYTLGAADAGAFEVNGLSWSIQINYSRPA